MYSLQAILYIYFMLVASDHEKYMYCSSLHTNLNSTFSLSLSTYSFLPWENEKYITKKQVLSRPSPIIHKRLYIKLYPSVYNSKFPIKYRIPSRSRSTNARLPTRACPSSFLVLRRGLCLLRCLGRSRASPWSQGPPDVPCDHGGVPVARSQPPQQRRLMEPQVTRSPPGGETRGAGVTLHLAWRTSYLPLFRFFSIFVYLYIFVIIVLIIIVISWFSSSLLMVDILSFTLSLSSFNSHF